MIYWQTNVPIINHDIPKHCLLSQSQMRKYKFDINNLYFFRKVLINSKRTKHIGKFRFAIDENELIELPRVYYGDS